MEKYFSFSGRIRRLHYALRTILVNTVVYTCVIAYGASGASGTLPLIMLFLVIMIATWFGLAAAVQRCHDMDKSGWYCLIPIYGPIIMFFIEGTSGWNEYGDDPKQAKTAAQPVQQQVPAAKTPQQKQNGKRANSSYRGGYIDKINGREQGYEDIDLTNDYFGAGNQQGSANTQQDPVSHRPTVPVKQPMTNNHQGTATAGKYKKGSLYK
jgi:uncharacterized membrane protein YhaH (DUF805 family)